MEYKTFWSSLFGSFQQVGQNISTRKWHCLFVKKGFEWDLSFTKFPHWSVEWKSLKRQGVEIVLDDKILHRCIMFIMPRHCKGWDKCKGFWESDTLSQALHNVVHMCTTVHCTMPFIWLCKTAQLYSVLTVHCTRMADSTSLKFWSEYFSSSRKACVWPREGNLDQLTSWTKCWKMLQFRKIISKQMFKPVARLKVRWGERKEGTEEMEKSATAKNWCKSLKKGRFMEVMLISE